jgi:hypothetical protein
MNILYENVTLMTEIQSLPATELALECKCCFEKVNPADQFCQKCGFPLKGSNAEQQIFTYRRGFKKVELKELDKEIKKASISLYVISGFWILWGLLSFITKPNNISVGLLISYGALAVIFLLLAFWSKNKPTAAIISGLSLVILLQLINMISDPKTLFSGIIVKLIVVGYLIKGFQSAQKAEKIKKHHNI